MKVKELCKEFIGIIALLIAAAGTLLLACLFFEAILAVNGQLENQLLEGLLAVSSGAMMLLSFVASLFFSYGFVYSLVEDVKDLIKAKKRIE